MRRVVLALRSLSSSATISPSSATHVVRVRERDGASSRRPKRPRSPAAIVAACARYRSLRCTRATLAARPRNWCAQSNAESPPPMITTRRPAKALRDRTPGRRCRGRTTAARRPAAGGAARTRRCRAATTTARVGKRSVSVTSVKWPSPSSSAATRWLQCTGEPNCPACSDSERTRSLASILGSPPTSKMYFSGYNAVSCPPASGSASTTWRGGAAHARRRTGRTAPLAPPR